MATTNSSVQFSVSQNIEKLEAIDADYRFMAFSDLSALLADPNNKPQFETDSTLVSTIIHGIAKRLDDPVADVQSQAVKCLEPLMSVLSEQHIHEIMDMLEQRFKGSPNGSSITYMALRTVVSKANATPSIARVLGLKLLPMLQLEKEWNIDSLDVLTDYLKRFGSSVSPNGVTRIENYLLEVISSAKGIVRKRAVVALGYLVRYLDNTRWKKLIDSVIHNLDTDSDEGSIQTMVFLTATLAKSESGRFRECLPLLFDRVVKCLHMEKLSHSGDNKDGSSNNINQDDDGDEDEDDSENLETREAVMTALEAFISLGFSDDSYIEKIVTVIANFISYDPNYNEEDDDDDSNDDDVDMGEDDEDDDYALSDDEGFSEDDDQSWKLRRYSCRLASALTQYSSQKLPYIYSNLLDLLIKRISSEREETVKGEALFTLTQFIKAASKDGGYYTSKLYVRRSSDASMAQESDPSIKLENYSEKVTHLAQRECSKAGTQPGILHGYISVLQNLISVLEGVGSELIDTVISVLEVLSNSKNQLMVDILATISAIFKHQPSESVDSGRLLALIVKGINDSYYKVSGEALDVATEVLEHHAIEPPSFPSQQIQELEQGIHAKVSSTSQDLETREKAVKCLARLLAVSTDVSQEALDQGFRVIVELVGNETLRIASIDAAETLAKSNKPLDQDLVSQTLSKLCDYLRQSSKTLRLNSLHALREFTSRGAGDQFVAEHVLAHAEDALLNDFDMQLISVVAYILADLAARVDSTLQERIGKFAVSVAATSDAALSGDAVLQLLASLASSQSKSSGKVTALYDQLFEKRNESPLMAQGIAAVIASGQPELSKVYEGNIDSGNDIVFSLSVLGSLGKISNLDIDLNVVMNQFNSSDDAVQLTAAQATGEITTNRLENFGTLINGLQNEDKAPLYLTSVREVIVSDRLKDIPSEIIEETWDRLFTIKVEDDSSMAKVAECVGKLSILNPEKCLPQLQSSLKNQEWSRRAIALSAVKYSFGQSHDLYDNLLRPIVIDFLVLIEDENLKIRQVAMSTLVAAIHNKHHLLIPHLAKLLPVLYNETSINKDLIRSVRFGPFKHKVDDGLELRKTAYEAIYTLVSTLSPEMLSNYVDLGQLFHRVLIGLSDEHDIKVLCCVIVGRVAQVEFSVISNSAPLEEGSPGGIENVIGLFNGLINVTVKENAIKQEFEKQGEVKRNVERTSHVIDNVIKGFESSGSSCGLSDVERSSWLKFYSGLSDDKRRSKK